MDLQVRTAGLCLEGGRPVPILFCKTRTDEQVAVRVHAARYYAYLQIPDTRRDDYLACHELKRRVNNYIKDELRKDRRCLRTKCSCSNHDESSPFSVFNIQPCLSGMKAGYMYETTLCTDVIVEEKYHLMGYQKRPSLFYRIEVIDPYFIRYVKRFCLRMIDDSDWTLESEIFAETDPILAFLYSSLFLDDERPNTMTRSTCCLRWIRLDEYTVSSQRLTRCPQEIVVKFDSIRYIEDAPMCATKLLTLDIECQVDPGEGIPRPERQRIVSIQVETSIQRGNTLLETKAYMISDGKPPTNTMDAYDFIGVQDERSMLLMFRDIIRDFLPDFIAGHNSDNFDWPYMFKRAEMLGILKEFSDFSYVKNHAVVYRATESFTAAFSRLNLVFHSPGIVMMDSMKIVQMIDKSLSSYKLNHIANIRLNQSKVDFPIEKINEYVNSPDDEKRNLFYAYGITDVVLVRKILNSYKAHNSMMMQCFVKQIFPDIHVSFGMGRNLEPISRAWGMARDILILSHRQFPVVPVAKRVEANKSKKKNEDDDPFGTDEADETAAPVAPAIPDGVTDDYSTDTIGVQKPWLTEIRQRIYKAVEDMTDEERKLLIENGKRRFPFIPSYVTLPNYNPIDGCRFDGYEGAYVQTPDPGYYNLGVVVIFDFASLYPSAMRTCNLSPDTLITQEIPGLGPDDVYTSAYGDRFVKKHVREGMFPTLVAYLMQERAKARAQIKTCEKDMVEFWDFLQEAFKIACNSMYGLLGTSTSFASCVYAARSVTMYGQESIKRTMKYIKDDVYVRVPTTHPCYERWNSQAGTLVLGPEGVPIVNITLRKIIYGDTDSVFMYCEVPHMVQGNVPDVDLAKHINESIAKSVNTESGLFASTMNLSAECVCYPFLMTKKKKKYCGMVRKSQRPEDSELKLKGLDVVRTNIPLYTRRVMQYLLDMILCGNTHDEIYAGLKRCIQRLISADIIIEKPVDSLEDIMRGKVTLRKNNIEKRKGIPVPQEPTRLDLDSLTTACNIRKKPPSGKVYKNPKDRPADEYADWHHDVLNVQKLWKSVPEMAATAPKFGEKVEYVYAQVPTSKYACERAVPVFFVDGSCATLNKRYFIDRKYYLESKFETGIRTLLETMFDEGELNRLFNIDLYTRWFRIPTQGVKRTAEDSESDPAPKRVMESKLMRQPTLKELLARSSKAS